MPPAIEMVIYPLALIGLVALGRILDIGFREGQRILLKEPKPISDAEAKLAVASFKIDFLTKELEASRDKYSDAQAKYEDTLEGLLKGISRKIGV